MDADELQTAAALGTLVTLGRRTLRADAMAWSPGRMFAQIWRVLGQRLREFNVVASEVITSKVGVR